MASTLELLEEHRIFGGWQQRWRHASAVELPDDLQHLSA